MKFHCSFCNQKKEGYACQGFRKTVICEDCICKASEAIKEKRKEIEPQVIGDTETLEQKLKRSLKNV